MRKTLSTLTLAAVMLFGSTLSFAGIIISDSAEPANCDATSNKGDGIIIFGKEGIIIFGIGIIIFGEKAEPCAADKTEGIIISD